MVDRRPSLVVVAGPNGSGKTTLTTLVLQHEWTAGHVYINADEIAENEYGGWNSGPAIMAAARTAVDRRNRCIEQRQDFSYETVFSTARHLRLIEQAKAAGYFVRVYFVGTSDPAINVRRVETRAARGGHDVPVDKIIARHGRSITNLTSVIPLADRVYVFDNSIDGAEPKRWARTRDGQIAKVRDGRMPVWIEDAITAPLPGRNDGPER